MTKDRKWLCIGEKGWLLPCVRRTQACCVSMEVSKKGYLEEEIEMSNRSRGIILLVLLAAIAPSASVFADTVWQGTVSNDWSTAANWSLGLPGTGNGAVIINPGGVNGDPVISTAGNTTNGQQVYMSIGPTLTVDTGGQLTCSDFVTGVWGASGLVTISGGQLTMTGYLNMGASGFEGDLLVTGGTVTAANLSINTSGGASIDMTGGQLIFPSGNLGNITYWIGAAGITAFGGTGTINVDQTTSPGNLILTPIAAAEGEQVRIVAMDCPQESTAPTVDGVIAVGEYMSAPLVVNSAFYAAGNGRYGTEIFGGWPGHEGTNDADYSYRVYTQWDATNLYVAFEVQDSTPVGGGLWTGDMLQIIVDPVGTGLGHFYFDVAVSSAAIPTYTAVTDAPVSKGTGGCNIPQSSIHAASAPIAGGYTVEVSLKWADMTPAVTPAMGSTIGLLFLGLDYDAAGTAEGAYLTGGGTSNPFEIPGRLSPVTLSGAIAVEGAITTIPAGPWFEAGTTLSLHAPTGMTNYQWKVDGEALTDNARIIGTTTDTLSFDPLELTDSGTYTCTYDNGAKALITTTPFVLHVLAPDSLPVAGAVGLGLLLGSFGIGAGIKLRRKSR